MVQYPRLQTLYHVLPIQSIQISDKTYQKAVNVPLQPREDPHCALRIRRHGPLGLQCQVVEEGHVLPL